MANEIKKILQDAIAKKRLRQLNQNIAENIESKVDTSEIRDTVVDSLYKSLEPVIERMVEKDRLTTKEITDALKGIKIEIPQMEMPEMKAPVVNVPAPIVNVPAPIVNFPEIEFPEYPEFPTEFSLRGVDKMKPLPVMMMGPDGKPMPMGSGGATGGRGDFFTIKGFETSAFSELTNPDGRIKVSVETGGSGLTDAELRATAVPVSQVSDAAWSVSVTDVFGSTGTNLVNPDGRLKVELPTGASGLTDTELRATAVPVSQVSGAAWSVLVTEVFGSTGTDIVNPDGRLKVELPTGSSGLTDTELRATSVPVAQVSGVAWSVSVNDVFGSTGTNIVNPDGRLKVELPSGASGLTDTELRASSVPVEQVSGSSWSTSVTNSVTVASITATVATANVDSTGVQYSGSNPLPIYSANTLDVRQVSGASDSVVILSGTVTAVTNITNSISASIIDSTGVMYGSANPFHIAVHDSTGSTITSFGSGDSKGLAVAIVDASGNQITSFGGGTQYAEGATASTYTGTAMIFAEASSDAAKVVSSVDPLPATLATALSSSIDSILSRPISLRGSLSTAYATLSTNTETTLLAASAGNFLDMVWIKFSNTSSGAVTVDLRDVAAGNIVDTYEVPANGITGISMAVPYPQGNQGNAWTVDYNDSDLSNTTVYVSGMFHKTT